MKVQKARLLQPIPNLGGIIPVPAQTQQGRATCMRTHNIMQINFMDR